MSSNPLSRRGFIGLLAALLAWCRGVPAATPSALPPPRNPTRSYRTLFRFVTTVSGDRRTTHVEAIGPTVEVTDALPGKEPPASGEQNGDVPSGSTPPLVSTYSYDCTLPSHLTAGSADHTTTYVYDSTSVPPWFGNVCTSVYDADGNYLFSVDGRDSSGSAPTHPSQQEKSEVTVEYRYGITTFPE
jgi:hypothetical protein